MVEFIRSFDTLITLPSLIDPPLFPHSDASLSLVLNYTININLYYRTFFIINQVYLNKEARTMSKEWSKRQANRSQNPVLLSDWLIKRLANYIPRQIMSARVTKIVRLDMIKLCRRFIFGLHSFLDNCESTVRNNSASLYDWNQFEKTRK